MIRLGAGAAPLNIVAMAIVSIIGADRTTTIIIMPTAQILVNGAALD